MTTIPPLAALTAPTQALPLRIPGATINTTPDVLLPVPAAALLDEAELLLFAEIVTRLGDPTAGPVDRSGCRCGQPISGIRAVGVARVRAAKAKVRGGRRKSRR